MDKENLKGERSYLNNLTNKMKHYLAIHVHVYDTTFWARQLASAFTVKTCIAEFKKSVFIKIWSLPTMEQNNCINCVKANEMLFQVSVNITKKVKLSISHHVRVLTSCVNCRTYYLHLATTGSINVKNGRKILLYSQNSQSASQSPSVWTNRL